jgi:hypothetical protein
VGKRHEFQITGKLAIDQQEREIAQGKTANDALNPSPTSYNFSNSWIGRDEIETSLDVLPETVA